MHDKSQYLHTNGKMCHILNNNGVKEQDKLFQC